MLRYLFFVIKKIDSLQIICNILQDYKGEKILFSRYHLDLPHYFVMKSHSAKKIGHFDNGSEMSDPVKSKRRQLRSI